MKITEFTIEDDFVNKGRKILTALAEDGSKWVVYSGQSATSLIPYDMSWNTSDGHKNIEKANGR